MSKLLANRVNKPGSSLLGPNLKTLDESEEVDMGDHEARVSEITPNRVLTDDTRARQAASPALSTASASSKLRGKRAANNNKYVLNKKNQVLNSSPASPASTGFLPELELPGSARSADTKASSSSVRKKLFILFLNLFSNYFNFLTIFV